MKKTLSIMIKIFAVVALLAIGVIIYSTCSGGSIIRKIDKSIPDAVSAPYQVTTKTHIYYAEQAYYNEDKSVTMLRWYDRIDNKWVMQKETLTLLPLLRPVIGQRSPSE